ncbi:integrin alpha-E isoform X2 [Suricata suricatta]|uniref:Integrin subunit alpha E n=1 Tax=Suricata suricatta TaxID=37032 RepID=A0A673VEB4_SURSU|nr:integrin alpha-E isoform X2 [Suricata suricatta]
MWLCRTLLCMTSLVPLVAFNVDVARTWVTSERGTPYVLSSLLHQDSSTNQTWLLVTSPQTNRLTGPLHRCSLIQDEILCKPVEHAPISKKRHQGVTVVRNDHSVLICIQVQSRKHHSLISELTGTCTLLANNFQPQAQIYFSDLENLLDPNTHVDARDCYRNQNGSIEKRARWRRALKPQEEEEDDYADTEAGTEIAIILDGSGSIDPPDFQRAKDFISNMMRNFYDKCFQCSFALVQYGEVIQTEFDLWDSQDAAASLAKVQNITQVGNVTKTASAIQHVLDNIFTPSQGSRKKASKVIVVLTDGDIFGDPLNLTTVISSPKMQGVERFAIGVGNAFKNSKTRKELELIASDPDDRHAFTVTNYTALDGLLSKLQQNIIHMEGTIGEALHYQLAQIGFSAQILDKGQVLLGAVGAFNWSGGALLYNLHSRRGRFLNQTTTDTKMAQYSYLGYSVALLHKACGISYVAGAPRYKQRGAVFELQKEGKETNFVPVLEGEQMGSYFGSELCPVDVDMDGTTDLLLVAAPFYHIHGEEGRVYVYHLTKQNGSLSLAHTLSGYPGFTDARFGFAMATVGDITQDKLTDVAIGAPLEGFRADDGTSFGSVYIYSGHWDGLSTTPSQRIRASEVASGLHYFGMSVAGGLDFTGDGLADITVGTLGRAAVLRSRPVVYLNVSITFTPMALPIGFNSSVNASLCFEISSLTTAAESGLKDTVLNFTLDVDVVKQRKRLQCSDKRICQSHLREWDSSVSHLCEPFLLIPTEGKLCEEDCFSNISVKVSYQLQTSESRRDHPRPVLDLYTEPSIIFQLPYEKNCTNRLFCVAKLQMAIATSRQELVVGLTKELTMNINLTNSGEDSYMTSITLNYPRNLQVKRIQKPPSPDIWCDDPKSNASVLVMNCKIGHPILSRSSAIFSVDWQLEENAFPNRTASIIVTATNLNEKQSLVRKTQSLRFKHAFTAVLPKPSVIYVNTSQGHSVYKEFFFNIHGENLFGAEFQLQICVPIELQNLQIIRVQNLTKIQDDTVCSQTQEESCMSDPVQRVGKWHSVSCVITSDKENVTVAAELFLSKFEQLLRDVTELQILGEISFNKSLYEGLNAENHRTKITVIFLKDQEYYALRHIVMSCACGLLLLTVIVISLFKCGFFKRKYQHLNLDGTRRAPLKSESLLTEEN